LVPSSLSNNERKKLTHKIIQGNPEDFLVQRIPEDASLFHYEIKEINKEKKKKRINK